jgi:hypothetical protein
MKKLYIAGRRVHVIAALHGNEKGPVRALEDSDIEFTLGNPKAYAANTRYIDRDLNASFKIQADSSYEAGRASELLNEIHAADLVIDFHTTSAVTRPFVILTDPTMLSYVEYTGLDTAVVMTHNIKAGHALINHRDGFSVEISGYDTPESAETTRKVIEHIQKGERTPFTVYEVFGRISEPGTYENFTYHSDGFYPILVGETSYDFIGLKARKLTAR